MSAIVHTLTVSDDDGDTLVVNDMGCSLEVRTTGGRIVVLDHDATQTLRTFLLDHLPPRDE